jgi:hypothetical protein
MFGTFSTLTGRSLAFLSNPATGRLRACVIAFTVLAVLTVLGVVLATVGAGQVHMMTPLASGQAWAE